MSNTYPSKQKPINAYSSPTHGFTSDLMLGLLNVLFFPCLSSFCVLCLIYLVFRDCPFCIASSVFSNVSFYIKPHDIIVKRGRGKLIVEEQKTYCSFFLLPGMPGFPELVDWKYSLSYALILNVDSKCQQVKL